MAQPKYVYETTFLVKRGTKEQWEKENPVLECGEIGYVIDENSIKIGDGSSYWTELNYVEDERLSEYGRVTIGQAEGVELGKKATSEGDQTQATGETSHAEGNKTIASARGAHAQGNSTEASGKYSHAEGEKSKAIGDMSHAAGSKSTAEGKYSHAEGRETLTCDTADGAHAEGYQTETEAPYSHVEGYKTEIASSAKYSHAEGSEAAISGSSEGAHAEGKRTEIDDASYSHAEGYASRTLSQYSHAEGIETIAGGDDSESDEGAHAEGNETMALARCAHSEGDNTEAQGKYSHAEGLQSISYGEGSHAEGVRTQAYGEASHSAGDRTIAWGDYSHAEGLNDETVSIVDLNKYYKIESDYNLDYLVRNPGWTSTSCSQLQVGSTVLVDGKSAVIEWVGTDSQSPTYGPSRIRLNRPAGTYVKVVDLQLHKNVHGAIGKASHSEGYYTQAIGNYSHAEGGGTDAIGKRSHAEGDCTEATGRASHAEGEETKAYGENSHAEGGYTEASGERSHAEGTDTTASGDYSHAEGESSIASGYASHAGGRYTIAAGKYQHVSGKYNIEDGDDKYAFIIGNGASDSERNNAFMVQWNGDAKLDGYLDVLGLKGDTVTRNLYVGGARKANGEWQPDGGFVVDHTPLNSTIKNEACISTLKVNEEGNYALTAPNGSNNLYKIQVIEDGSTRTLDINTLPIITAGTYSDGFRYSVDNTFVIRFGSKTKIESNTKTFTDGTTCYKRLSYQQSLKYSGDLGENPYPSVEFSTNGPATIKIWWVAGDANRYFAIQHRHKNSGSARLEVTGNFVAHGPSDFRGTAVFEDVEIDGRLETRDIHVGGFIETSESIECGGSIKVESEIKAGGTATFENDVKIKNNSNREHTVKLRDALHEALDFDFKKRIPFNASELLHSASWNDLKEQVEALREISATTLTLDEEEYTFEIGDEPIEIWKDFTLKGINEKPVIINFNYTGTASDFTIFKAMAPDLKISFENVVIAETIQPWNVTSIFFQNNGQTGTKISIKDCQINGDDYLSQDFTKCCGRWNVDGAERLFIQDTIINKAAFIGTVGYFDGGNNNLLDSISYGCFYYLNPRERVSYFCDYGATTEGIVCQAIGHGSHAEGHATQAISKDNFDISDSVEWQFATPAHAEGESTKAYGGGAHAEGVETQALGYGSHAEGRNTTASGDYSHAEGYYNVVASGYASHAEGNSTTASGDAAHAEGSSTQALGPLSHTEGGGSIASGDCSHAEGANTIAAGFCQHVQGTFNIKDTGNKYAHIVGNGTLSNSSNAHTLDWDGNAWYAGNIYIGGASQDDENAKKLATEEFVTNALSGVEHPTPDLTGYATEEFVNTTIQQNAYTLPTATAEAIGGVKVGDTLEISADGALNVKQTETPTELYLMSPGGLKFKITVSDVGELSAEQVV